MATGNRALRTRVCLSTLLRFRRFQSERKVITKYYPPDFDPSKIPRRKIPRETQQKVRLMAPFSMQCATCGDYIYKGKKFNARKERAEGETYLGVQVFRFYIRCPRCATEITFKTDPQNADYVAEHGAVRNFEPWREQSTVQEELDAEREAEEENNPMRALENRTLESKREMDILDALDEIRAKNAALERSGGADLVAKLAASAEEQEARRRMLEEEEDERLAQAIFRDADGDVVKRLEDPIETLPGDDADDAAGQPLRAFIADSDLVSPSSFDAAPGAGGPAPDAAAGRKRPFGAAAGPAIVVKKRVVAQMAARSAPTAVSASASAKEPPAAAKPKPAQAQALGLLAGYADSDEDE
ncbi:Pre-mRNA-splicing factor cwf16 [Polyrhizophydium stewartii]|uniref:Splicing factor YJU2 n=1 Tax=Polyrhizophydium stewartii TaxID=2732419 RepID=A0ABR4N2U1_9FUNG|nr:hypothetical protein HK105_005150 [Polyrhizophydium stewartii]